MASANSVQFTQSTASSTWTINHGLGVYPIVDVLVNHNGVLTKMIPNGINVIDLNNITITFSSPYSGIARLV